MSLAELLPAIRALPRTEKAELMHILVDEVAAPPRSMVDDGITDEMRKLLPPPGSVIEIGWFYDVRADFDLAAVLQELLQRDIPSNA